MIKSLRKRLLISSLAVVVVLAGIYLYADREILSLKTGRTLPLHWENPYEDPYRNEEPTQLTKDSQTLSTPNIHLTPLYYLPVSKKLQFGLWYNKKEYQPDRSKKIPDRIFHITVLSEDGQSFDHDTVMTTEGLFDEFQHRSIDVDLSNQDSIEITISLIEQDGTVLTPIQSTSFNVQLK